MNSPAPKPLLIALAALTLALGAPLLAQLDTAPTPRATPREAPAEGEAAPDATDDTAATTGTPEEPQFDVDKPELPGESDAPLSVEQIEAMINLPASAQLGREADEDIARPRNLFADPNLRTSMLGKKPRFVYFPQGSDPMIIPWIRDQIVARELMADAKKAKDAGDTEKAKTILENVVRKYPSSPEAKKAVNELKDMAARMRRIDGGDDGGPKLPDFNPTPSTEAVAPPPELPGPVRAATKGILVDERRDADSQVLVGDYILRTGDLLPDYPTITVKSIAPGEVVYLYQNTDFMVPVSGKVTQVADSKKKKK